MGRRWPARGRQATAAVTSVPTPRLMVAKPPRRSASRPITAPTVQAHRSRRAQRRDAQVETALSPHNGTTARPRCQQRAGACRQTAAAAPLRAPPPRPAPKAASTYASRRPLRRPGRAISAARPSAPVAVASTPRHSASRCSSASLTVPGTETRQDRPCHAGPVCGAPVTRRSRGRSARSWRRPRCTRI